MAEQPLPLRVDIVSDVVCPWCIIGYRQLQRAFDAMPGLFEPVLAWQPFELNPQMPPEGQELREHMAQKYGASASASGRSRQRLTELGESLGFHFDYFEGMRMVNTFAAHQLLHWAGEQGAQTALKLALFEAFFSRRQDVSDRDVLAATAQAVGLDGAEARALLADGRYADTVRAEQEHWRERDVHAVPTFFFQGRYMVPGAQESGTFERVLARIHTRETESALQEGTP